jgi:mono/diheme cytochrome c family protein
VRTFLIVGLITGFASFSARAADAKAGQLVYEVHCKGCHGPNGAAPANVAKFANGRIADLRSSQVQSLSNADLVKTITLGKGKMRGDTTIMGKDLDDLIAFLHEIK